jgi:hypothetical protein
MKSYILFALVETYKWYLYLMQLIDSILGPRFIDIQPLYAQTDGITYQHYWMLLIKYYLMPMDIDQLIKETYVCKFQYRSNKYYFITYDTINNIFAHKKTIIDTIDKYNSSGVNYRLNNVIFYGDNDEIVDVPMDELVHFYPLIHSKVDMRPLKLISDLKVILQVLDSDCTKCLMTKIVVPTVTRQTLMIEDANLMDLFE